MTSLGSTFFNQIHKLKGFQSKIINHKFKQSLFQTIPFWGASLITGLIAVLYAKIFAAAEDLTLSIVHKTGWLLFIITPVCFVTSWWLVKYFAKAANGSGIPQVIAAIKFANPRQNHLVEALLSIRVIIIKIISSVLMVLGGGAIGREGPTIQIAGSIFWSVNKYLPKSWAKISKKNIIVAGGAAGLAAAFNTPLGGIVFAVEELSSSHLSHFKTAIFTAVIIAGLTAQGILGPYLYIGFPIVENLSKFIMLYVLVVAVIAGILGTLMCKLILKIQDFKKHIKGNRNEIIYVITVAMLIASVAYFFNESILGSGRNEMLKVLFTSNKQVGWQIPVMRIIGPILSYTTGAAGGVFAPSLSAGAMVGAFLSELCKLSASNANMLILAGMVAFLTGVTKSPFTSAILVLEMTDKHNLIFHLMLAGFVAGLVSNLIDKQSLYSHLEQKIIRDISAEEALSEVKK